MKERINREDVLDGVDIAQVIGAHIQLKKQGNEYVACCPFHKESTPSFKVNANKGMYKCFGCGKGGDAIAFLMDYLGLTYPQACNAIKDLPQDRPQQTSRNEPPPPQWVQIVPVPSDAPEPDFNHPHFNSPSNVWAYTTADGEVAAYVARFDTKDGKEVLPLIYATNGVFTRWRWQGMVAPRPLYRLADVYASPNIPVLIVEGEKTADVAAKNFRCVVVSWPGGGNAVSKVDWRPLTGRTVIIWPDFDEAGYQAMHRIAEMIEPIVERLMWVQPPYGVEKGWDLADCTWDADRIRNYAKNNYHDILPVVPFYPGAGTKKSTTLPETTNSVPESTPQSTAVAKLPPPPVDGEFISSPDSNNGFPFTFLGWDKSESSKASYYFYSFSKKTVISIASSGMGVTQLLELAPMSLWEETFPKANPKHGGFELSSAQDWIFRSSDVVGPYNPSIRGRGAWMDKGEVVVHNGPYLIKAGKRVELNQIKSRHIYENAPEIGFDLTTPLPDSESVKLFDIVNLMNWERPVNGTLLLGWCALAPVCGALTWRPHIWITASSGAGKSWVFQKIVRRLIGQSALAVQGDSTEAGLRQTLGHDAMPVVFDEAENEDERASGRIQNVLALMRTASSDDGGLLVKGSAMGTAKTFKIRSCFAYASIVVQARTQADRSRVTILGLVRKTGSLAEERFKKLERMHNELITDEFVQNLRTRTVTMLPTILENIKVFKSAATEFLSDARIGDQIGTLLAGAYSLRTSEIATRDIALAWMEAHDWTEERGLDQTRDEVSLLNHILEQTETLDLGSGSRTALSIGEFIVKAASNGTDSDLCNEVLGRAGIKVHRHEGMFSVANQHSRLKGWLAKTPWGNNHGKLLQRLPGAKQSDSPMRFATVVQRAVSLPITLVMDAKPVEPQGELYTPKINNRGDDEAPF